MKSLLIFLVFVTTSISVLSAQRIEAEKILGGYKYTQDGKVMSFGNLKAVMQSNPEAAVLINKAKSTAGFSTVLGVVGGALVGYPLGTAITGGDPNWTLAGIGAGIIAIGIPVSASVNKNALKAIELYNGSLSSVGYKANLPSFKLVLGGDGIGVGMTF